MIVVDELTLSHYDQFLQVSGL